ncbi:unnamed protein product, partial [Tetraodon nigroviridis]
EARAEPRPQGRAPGPSAMSMSSFSNGSGSKKLPQAIIIGVKKGGTRALLEFLRVHPDIRAVGAEPHFFDRNYENGLEWYSWRFVSVGKFPGSGRDAWFLPSDPVLGERRCSAAPASTQEGSADSQAALTRCSSLMELRVLGAAFINQIRTRAHSLGVRVSRSRRKSKNQWIPPVLMLELMPKTLEGQITMEKTPSYFVTREAPARISAMSRDTKLIVVVRDPVTRAISDYTQTLSKKPDIPSFESLTFKNRTTGLIDTSWSAVQIGIYAKHLDNWLQYFPMRQILFVSGERLISDPAGELGRVQDFLGLKRIITDKHFYFNQTKGFPCLKKAEGSSKPHCLGKTKGRTHPNIDPEVVQRLRDFYRPFNMKFYQMTGHDFGWD